jgi:hypothetical protein
MNHSNHSKGWKSNNCTDERGDFYAVGRNIITEDQFARRKIEKGFVESGVPARSKYKSE